MAKRRGQAVESAVSEIAFLLRRRRSETRPERREVVSGTRPSLEIGSDCPVMTLPISYCPDETMIDGRAAHLIGGSWAAAREAVTRSHYGALTPGASCSALI